MNEPTKFELIVKEADLTPRQEITLLEQFKEFSTIAEEWEAKARSIVVTNDSQTDDMAMARKGRLLLQAHRVEIEKRRKALKAGIIRQGKAIEHIANILKDAIIPLEKHLYRQENFVKIREAKIAEEKTEAERVKREKEEAEELEREQEAERLERERVANENADLKKQLETTTTKLDEQKERTKDIRAENLQLKRVVNQPKPAPTLPVQTAKTITCPKCGHQFNSYGELKV